MRDTCRRLLDDLSNHDVISVVCTDGGDVTGRYDGLSRNDGRWSIVLASSRGCTLAIPVEHIETISLG